MQHAAKSTMSIEKILLLLSSSPLPAELLLGARNYDYPHPKICMAILLKKDDFWGDHFENSSFTWSQSLYISRNRLKEHHKKTLPYAPVFRQK